MELTFSMLEQQRVTTATDCETGFVVPRVRAHVFSAPQLVEDPSQPPPCIRFCFATHGEKGIVAYEAKHFKRREDVFLEFMNAIHKSVMSNTWI
ncbi:hypothetical protein HW555_005256 [Spodoptera exigua]|uniref:Uncharacterized protein n=1 Tax=Spodoptera exigua TaxID=7107 RepID=A0A835GI57_SPOEX|nr:hypothetical protein HW555_005256 [Spodoptera exigua]